jgi:hypothetical protein
MEDEDRLRILKKEKSKIQKKKKDEKKSTKITLMSVRSLCT